MLATKPMTIATVEDTVVPAKFFICISSWRLINSICVVDAVNDIHIGNFTDAGHQGVELLRMRTDAHRSKQ